MGKLEAGLYEALEAELKKSTQPMDCYMLFEKAGVRAHAATVNRVSDYLGNMWRKGQLSRLPAPSGRESTRARWMYLWKGRKVATPDPDQAVAFDTNKLLVQRPNMEITENGAGVTIELPNLVITIKYSR